MTHRPISSLLLYIQVVAVWALILVASIFSVWNGSHDQLISILFFGAAAITVPAYQLVMRALDRRTQARESRFVARCLARGSAKPSVSEG